MKARELIRFIGFSLMATLTAVLASGCSTPKAPPSRELPQAPEARSNRSGSENENSGLDKPIAEFTKAIELKPDDAEAYNHRGSAKQAKGDLDGAIADFTKAIQLKPDDAGAYNNRGSARQDKGNLDVAIAAFTK